MLRSLIWLGRAMWYFISYLAGAISMLGILEYAKFKFAQAFHRMLKTELTWRKYYGLDDR